MEEEETVFTRCPACGNFTILEPHDYEICPVCGWEDAGLEADCPTISGGANGPTLIGARIRFRETGTAEPGFKSHIPSDYMFPDSGLEYPFPEYYYDTKNDYFLIKCRKYVFLKAWRYGSADDKTGEKYEALSKKARSGGRYMQICQDIIDGCPEEYERYLPFEVLSEPGVVRLNFAGYVKKISTQNFKDGVLFLGERKSQLLERVCGISIEEILEMDDDGCEKIFKMVKERSPELAEALKYSIYELIWDVPDWMADWG